MLAKTFLKLGKVPNSIQNSSRKPGSNKQRVALLHVRASSPNESDKNSKDSEELGGNMTLKVVPALLSEQRGVGVIATVGIAMTARLAQAVSI